MKQTIQKFSRDWLGSENGGGRIAFIKWDGGRAQEGNDGTKKGNHGTIKRYYYICFRDWTMVGQGIPLRSPSDFPDPFPPHQLTMAGRAMVWSGVSKTAAGGLRRCRQTSCFIRV
ncbi:hypothetical protein CBR_g29525 [Chara braunii]|uniref:Uncharacterized protein n=1 Tax=Chara braunii TaxID=69332 RepID=A0A388LAR3_CHABU|nr:hypothetical protein CBR_g29525 [Chara braunii]|eukprot:GBG79376.1 hypothetical protein CBR_g29525 [Chara braunii]